MFLLTNCFQSWFSGKTPPFKAALKKQGEISVIAELKASPSRGLIRGDFDCANLALGLQNSGAAALSILTEKTISWETLNICVKFQKLSAYRCCARTLY
ncbi:MAG: hypothetical protein ACLUKN_04080 [Bacilli bacterium]